MCVLTCTALMSVRGQLTYVLVSVCVCLSVCVHVQYVCAHGCVPMVVWLVCACTHVCTVELEGIPIYRGFTQ